MSIKQNAYSDGLPDFRNLGVTARILVAVNLAALAAACYAETGWARSVGEPSSLNSSLRFCSAGKKPGVMVLTRTPDFAHSRARNWLRLGFTTWTAAPPAESGAWRTATAL